MPFSFFPQRVYQTTSKLSGEIVVKKQFGKCKLYVQGVLQSGGIVKNIWQKAIKKVLKTPPRWCCACLPRIEWCWGGTPRRWTEKGKRILILGLGGGTVINLIDKLFLKEHFVKGGKIEKIEIVGVEIDPEIIRVGRKYFGLGEIKNLQIIQANAFAWIKTYSNDTYHWSKNGKRRKNLDLFDLIIVDLYLGKKFPKKAESKKFLKNIKKLLAKDGIAIFNRLRVREANLAEFEEKLAKNFSSVEEIKTSTNLFFLARS